MKHRSLYFVIAMLVLGASVFASSHREAPFITENPKVDNTDFYIFRSYDAALDPVNDNFTTIISNFGPLQDPNGGPNYFFPDPEALYEIMIDNTGDGVEDITFQIRFQVQFKNQAGVNNQELPLIAFVDGTVFPAVDGPPPAFDNDPAVFVQESYTVTVVQGDRRKGTRTAVSNLTLGGNTFFKPLDNIGTQTIPNYNAYAVQHQFDMGLPGGVTGKIFVGQRREGFIVELGGVFDSINLDAAEDNINNALRFKSVTSIIIEVPTSFLGNGATVFGAWSSNSMRQARILNPFPQRANNAAVEGGAFSQVSRLGMPLTNELIIGVSTKDRFNTSEPKDDAQFADFVLNSNLALALNLRLGANFPTTNRTDLAAIFVTGLDAGIFNNTFGTGEMQRLDTTIPPIIPYDAAVGLAGRDGIFANDGAGFPNGRRPFDDVVDIELGAVAAVGAAVRDNAIANFTVGVYYLDVFPYLADPIAGNILDFPDDGFEVVSKK